MEADTKSPSSGGTVLADLSPPPLHPQGGPCSSMSLPATGHDHSPGIPFLPVLPSPSISPAPPGAGDLKEGVSGYGDSTSLRHMMVGPLSRAGAGSHLVTWVIVLLQVRVGQSLFHLNPLMRVERQHLVQ